jgi:hypothetical protein
MRALDALCAWSACIAFGLAARADPAKPLKVAEGQVIIETSVDLVGGNSPGRFGGRGAGRCVHDEKGGSYEWVVSADIGEGAGRSMVLLYAPPSSGTTDQISLSVTAGSATVMISSMKGAPPMGKGHLTVTQTGKRARLVVTGAGDDGTKVNVKIDCESSTAN